MKPFFGSFGLAAFLLVGSAASHAAIITASSATTSGNTYPGTSIAYTIDGSGLIAPVTYANYATVTHSLGFVPASDRWVDINNTTVNHITFGFNTPVNLDQVLVWNYTQESGLTNRGIKTFDIQVDAGSGFSTIASASIHPAIREAAKHKPQAIYIGPQKGVEQLRFLNVTNQGGNAIGLDEVMFRNSGAVAPVPGFVGVLGNDTTTNRSAAGDGGTTVFWTNAYGAPVAGTVSEVTLRYQGGSATGGHNQSFELFQLRPTGVANQYEMIARSGSMTPSGTSGTTLTYAFPGGTAAATEFHLQPGDMLAHYGQAIPFTQNSNTAAVHNSQYIYYPVASSALAVGSTVLLGQAPFPLFAQRRDYAWSVDLPGFVETVGAGAGKAPNAPDSDSYLVVLDQDAFTQPGKLATWQWFNDTADTGGHNLTPVLLREDGSMLTAIGIGATRAGGTNGFQQYNFDLVSGTDRVEPGDLFGFYYGDGTSGNAGSVQYAALSGGPTVRLFTGIDGIGLGSITATATSANRWYSINASTVPEPGAWLLLLSALACGLLVRRRR